MRNAFTAELAVGAFKKHREVHGDYDGYTGIVSLHGFARLATESGSASLLNEAKSQLAPYVAGERKFHANFPNYLCGGNATAWMHFRGEMPEAEQTLRHYAEQIIQDAPRSKEGILCHPNDTAKQQIWIDVAFAVSPFLLFTGLSLGNEAYVNEAFEQTRKMVELFKDDNGLLRQCCGFRSDNARSDDNWSRGNGWGIYALTELATYLPATHPHKTRAIAMYRDLIDAILKEQDPAEGLWRQEMSDVTRRITVSHSYIETSGSALFLYAIGVGLRSGLLRNEPYREAFEKGLSGLLAYISDELDIYHTCPGCLNPGNGTKVDYRAVGPVINDRHAFGPIVLAMGQAHLLGIEKVTRLTK